MIFFWLFYFFINFLISFSVFKILNNKFLGIVLAFLVFGTLSGIWFIYPGSQNLAPIVSIFFLENTIVESNGLIRLLRPLFFLNSILLIFGIVLFFLMRKK